MHKHTFIAAAITAVLATISTSIRAAEWSDTFLGYRYGTHFAEPFGANDIHKNIFSLTHGSGYKYGTNFFNVDLLLSDKKDPAFAGSNDGAHEAYVVYRHTLDIGKVRGQDIKFGPFRGVGLTAGFDFNAKTDAGYNSKKRMVVLGPTLMVDVPGFFNVSLLALWESNAPYNTFTGKGVSRYTYDTHPMLNLAWGIPFSAGSVPLSFQGFANFISSKGKNEFGGGTAPETNIDMQIMYDLSPAAGASKDTFKVGFEYQYWRNKFGTATTAAGAGAGPGATAKTPMVRVEYHF